MKYEYAYSGCMDYMFFDGEREDIPPQVTMFEFLQSWGADLLDADRAGAEFLALLEKWHEEGIIAPCKETN